MYFLFPESSITVSPRAAGFNSLLTLTFSSNLAVRLNGPWGAFGVRLLNLFLCGTDALRRPRRAAAASDRTKNPVAKVCNREGVGRSSDKGGNAALLIALKTQKLFSHSA